MKYIKLFEAKKEDPFIQASKRGSSAKVKDFIKSGVNLNVKDSEGMTALMHACLNKFLMIVDILIKAGVDVNIQNRNGRTALMYCSTESIINKLLDAGADVNIQEYDKGDIVIMDWFNQFSPELTLSLINKFLEKGLDLDIKNKNGQNYYDKLKDELESSRLHVYKSIYRENWLNAMIWQMDTHFPKYKEEWELKRDIQKYNL